MAAAVVTEGTQAATPSTEHAVYDSATVGVFTFVVDVTNLSGTETVELRSYVKVKTAGSYRQAHVATFAAGELSPAVVSLPFVAPNGIKFTLKQIGGSSRNFDWSVWSV